MIIVLAHEAYECIARVCEHANAKASKHTKYANFVYKTISTVSLLGLIGSHQNALN